MTSKRDRRARGAAAVRKARPGTSPLVAVGVLAVILFAAVLGFGLYRHQQAGTAVAIPPGATADGVVVGHPDAPVTVDVYLDFQCPVCAQYERETGPTLTQLAESGTAKVVYHPVAYLDRFSSTRYSSRSSVAAGCVAGSGAAYPRFQELLFARQPPEGGAGLGNDQLAALAAQAGAGGDTAECIGTERFAGWTAALTEAASRAGINGTPTVLVNGRPVEHTPQALRDAVADAR